MINSLTVQIMKIMQKHWFVYDFHYLLLLFLSCIIELSEIDAQKMVKIWLSPERRELYVL